MARWVSASSTDTRVPDRPPVRSQSAVRAAGGADGSGGIMRTPRPPPSPCTSQSIGRLSTPGRVAAVPIHGECGRAQSLPIPTRASAGMVTAIPTTSTKNGQALIALLPGVASHERHALAAHCFGPACKQKKRRDPRTMGCWPLVRRSRLFLENRPNRARAAQS